jgi:hypothetical protein
MHAVLVSAKLDEGRLDEAREHLQNFVIPSVKQLPGAVSGHWLAPMGGRGYSTVLFETEDQAKSAAEGVAERAPEFITIERVDVQEVVAHF